MDWIGLDWIGLDWIGAVGDGYLNAFIDLDCCLSRTKIIILCPLLAAIVAVIGVQQNLYQMIHHQILLYLI